MPANVVLPHVAYSDVLAAVEYFIRTFGFVESYRYGDPVAGVMVHLGDAYVMMRRAREGSASPATVGRWTQSLTVFVDDVDAHYRAAKAAGAKIVEDLHETIYGERQYGVEDPEGHHWLFSRHARDVDPREWGAKVA